MTKKEIQSVLRTLNRTAIFKAAKQEGVDVSNREAVVRFIEAFAPSKKVRSKAWSIALGRNKRDYSRYTPNTIGSEFEFAKWQKANLPPSRYQHLIVHKRTIYWVPLEHTNEDCNQCMCIALPNSERNRRAAVLINHYLGYNTELCK